MTSFVSSSPQLYGVIPGAYASNWVHDLEAENIQSFTQDQIVGLSTITVAPNIFYYGNNYCNLVTEGKVCKISLQYDLNCSVGSIMWNLIHGGPLARPELRFSNDPNLFPVSIGEPLLKGRITLINTGQQLALLYLNVYGRLLRDGTIALVYDTIYGVGSLGHMSSFGSGVYPVVPGNFFAGLAPYWNANQAVGISISIEDSFLVA